MGFTQQMNVTVVIPPEYVLIPKDEYQKLLDSQMSGKWWGFKDLANRTQREREWLESKILYKPNLKKILDVEENPNGFVNYPTGKGSKWAFEPNKMSKFLEEYFPEIMKKESGNEKNR